MSSSFNNRSTLIVILSFLLTLAFNFDVYGADSNLDSTLKNLLAQQKKKHETDTLLNKIKTGQITMDGITTKVEKAPNVAEDDDDEKSYPASSTYNKISKSTKESKILLEDVVSAQSSVIIDVNSNKLIYTKNPFKQMAPASLTKIMTAIVAIEATDDLSKPIKLAHDMKVRSDGVALGLKEGDETTMNDLLYMALLYSANDACIAIAEEVAGSVSEFAKIMNQKAKDIGAVNTNFVNPNGMPNSQHYSNAYDIAVIANYAMKNSTFAKIVGTKYKTVEILSNHEVTRKVKQGKKVVKVSKTENYIRKIKLTNRHKLLGKVEGVRGIKTGYTVKAGRCLATAYNEGAKNLIIVVLKAKDVASDTMALINYDKYMPVQNIASSKLDNKMKGSGEKAFLEKVSLSTIKK